jgi:TDG/mug DNA glycosylase family protein
MIDILPDHLCPGLKVVFCGTAAGDESARRKAYYAGPGNQFWPILAKVGLTPRQFAPDEFLLLNGLGIGLTDIAKKVSGADAVLPKGCLDGSAFTEKMSEIAPEFIAFNGKKSASVFLGQPTRQIAYGLHADYINLPKLFVLPSTSGTARRFWDESHWFELARLMRVAGQPC